MMRRLAWGAAAAVLYLGTALALGASGVPVLPIFDGVQPPAPYRWVDPPPELAEQNQPALGGSFTLPFESLTAGFGVVTEDGQAQVSGSPDAVPEPRGQEALHLEIVPRDPDRVAAPPEGLRFDGNAYEVRAEYRPSGRPASPAAPVSVVVRYPLHATILLRWTGSRWERLQSTPVPATLQVFAETPELGVFVAAAEGEADGFPWSLVAAGAAGAALGLGGLAWWHFRRRRRPKRGPDRTSRKRRRQRR